MRQANNTMTNAAPIVPPAVVRSALQQNSNAPKGEQITVALGEHVFNPGEHRRVYRIESGAVSHFQNWPDGRVEVIEFAFPGDTIGLGYLPDHTSSAVAMVDTVVSVMSTDILEQRLAVEDRLAFSLANAGEREFEYVRAKSVSKTLLPPLQQLANYLLAIASIEKNEGRETALIADEITSGFVASQLRMSIDTLSMALLSLRRSGILELSGNRLRIVDVDKLEAVAAAA